MAGDATGKKMTITDDWESSDYDSLYVLTLTWHNGKASLQSHVYKQGLDNGAETCPT
ncbi:hypothetical protein D3C85_1734610 [compost metagenome]